MLKRMAVLILALAWASPAAAAEPRTITWDDLVPPGAPIHNPFRDLSVQTRDDLGYIARSRLDLELGYIVEGDEEHKDALAVEARLKEEGHDVDGLLEAARKIEEEFRRRDNLLDESLDGQTIRMPGYALPLEFSGTGVQEFLLVPYVGACIHAPAPPLNQTIYVALNQTYKMSNLYDAVWITGVMKVEKSTRALNYVDGLADVNAGYRLEALQVEPYR